MKRREEAKRGKGMDDSFDVLVLERDKYLGTSVHRWGKGGREKKLKRFMGPVLRSRKKGNVRKTQGWSEAYCVS